MVPGSYHWKCRALNFLDNEFKFECNRRWTICSNLTWNANVNAIIRPHCNFWCRFLTYNLQGGTVMSNLIICIFRDKWVHTRWAHQIYFTRICWFFWTAVSLVLLLRDVRTQVFRYCSLQRYRSVKIKLQKRIQCLTILTSRCQTVTYFF